MFKESVTPYNTAIPIILAGGLGSRVKHLLPNIPKPMAIIQDKPFIHWVCHYLLSQGYPNPYLSTGYLSEKVTAYFENNENAFQSKCIPESEPLGTGGALQNILRNLPPGQTSPYLVLNGDSLVLAPLSNIEAYFLQSGADALIIGLEVANTSRFGRLSIDENHTLLSFEEKKGNHAGIINAGVYFFNDKVKTFVLNEQAPFSIESDLFPKLLENAFSIKVYPINAPFIDIGTPESLPEAEDFIQKHLAFLNYDHQQSTLTH